MYIHEGRHIGDAWFFVDDAADAVHMFYLSNPLGPGPRFVGHAVSGDLVNWETLPPALYPGSPGSWDDLLLCTGSVIKCDGRYWMAYSGTSLSDSSPEEPWRVQRAGVAVSDDLCVWRKLPENPVSQPGPPHYEWMSTGERQMVHWRDPFLFDDGEAAYQFICARRTDGDPVTRGTVALTRSTDMREWEPLAPLEHDRIAQEMEVPQVYEIDGRWYLVFCTLGRFLSPDFARCFQGAVPERSNLAMVGSSPFGPFHIHGTGQIVCHALDAYFYAAQLVKLHGEWYLLATVNEDGSAWVSDPVRVHGDETGVHACET